MADKVHLDELIAQQSDLVARGLLEEFAKLVRDQHTEPSEYSARLRKLMDGYFKGASNATGQPNDP